MSQKKKKMAALDKNIMEDVKGGIPYEDPGLVVLDDPAVVPGEPGDPGDPVTASTGPCSNGNYNIKDGCSSGYKNTGQDGSSCGDGSHNNAGGPCHTGDHILPI